MVVLHVVLLYGAETNLWLEDPGMQSAQKVHYVQHLTTVTTHHHRGALDNSSIPTTS